MLILGTYIIKIDAKNRITIPSKFVQKLSKVLYLSYGYDGCLQIRTDEQFKIYSEKLLASSDTKIDIRKIQRVFFANTVECEIDANNRILLPTFLIEKINIKNEILVIGRGNLIELWEKQTGEKYLSDATNSYEDAAEKINE